MKLELSADVEASPETVWRIMSDVDHWPEWTASVGSVERLGGQPLEVGAKVRIRQPRLPVAIWRVTDKVPGQSFSWEAHGPGLRTRASHRVEDIGGGRSRVTLSIDQGGPLARIVGFIWDKLTREYVSMEIEGLKRQAESL
jgi:uncharacterized protein YndB with AHSA1/START domain